ncbi:hypothetical protein LZD49_10640 [Dyadobacter sp. CY261]|nr:hypothetical protein [Dyadobacter sp. CY261]MCF0070930.1 hypothetical protein [Dyadobacter sp. CY261]
MDMKILEELQEWGAQVARLVELVAMTNTTLQLHMKDYSPNTSGNWTSC